MLKICGLMYCTIKIINQKFARFVYVGPKLIMYVIQQLALCGYDLATDKTILGGLGGLPPSGFPKGEALWWGLGRSPMNLKIKNAPERSEGAQLQLET